MVVRKNVMRRSGTGNLISGCSGLDFLCSAGFALVGYAAFARRAAPMVIRRSQ
jgi:hypothetical protein